MSWSVLESDKTLKQLDRSPREIQDAFEAWKLIVLNEGPMGLTKVNGYWDHALTGEWKGARSSSLNKQWRVIYTVQNHVFKVLVLRVTAHDYRRK